MRTGDQELFDRATSNPKPYHSSIHIYLSSTTAVCVRTGDRELFDRATPMLDVMGKKSFFLGAEVGAGAKMKLVINMVRNSFRLHVPPLNFITIIVIVILWLLPVPKMKVVINMVRD